MRTPAVLDKRELAGYIDGGRRARARHLEMIPGTSPK